MTLRHRVNINVRHSDGVQEPVLRSGQLNLFSRALSKITGGKVGVLVIMPGETVDGIEIHEVRTGGEAGG